MNILLTSVGRRVELLKAFRQSMCQFNIKGKIIAVDSKQNAPACFLADTAELVPKINDPTYIDSLLDICDRHSIDLLIPLIDTELQILSLHQQQFRDRGITLLISSVATNEICYSKKKTSIFFEKIGVKTPKIYELNEVTELDLPLILKPDTGSSSVGLYCIQNQAELEFFSTYVEDAIVQELITGEEYTIDILVDFQGKVISIVPRLRIETRAGEIIFIEINPRFGGGYPLSYRAGADFPSWLMQLYMGEHPQVAIDEWEDGLAMLRYDDAIFVKANEIGIISQLTIDNKSIEYSY